MSFPALSPQVEDLNAKWQCYDASRDEYVRGLHAQLRGLQAPCGPERPSAPELMRKEISRLNRQLEERVNDCAAARRELAALRMAQDAALERTQMLEQQVSAPWDSGTGPVGTFIPGAEMVQPGHSSVSRLLSDSRVQG